MDNVRRAPGDWCDLGPSPDSLTSMGSLARREHHEKKSSGRIPGWAWGTGSVVAEMWGLGRLPPPRLTGRVGVPAGLRTAPYSTSEC